MRLHQTILENKNEIYWGVQMELKDSVVKELEFLTGRGDSRIVCWFSHGIASTIATKLTIMANNKMKQPKKVVVADIYLEEEHKDNIRFYKEVKEWLLEDLSEEEMSRVEFTTLMNEKYQGSVDNVINTSRYMSGIYGAMCTSVLKKEVRYSWQQPNDVHVFGMTVEEQSRIDRLLDGEADILVFAPLIEQGLTKMDCFDWFSVSNIKPPIMYELGFNNNNCKGCLKASGAGYWNLTRKLFKDLFDERARQEEWLGVALVKIAGNVILNKHREAFYKMNEDIISGVFPEIKVDGKELPPLKDGKPQHCTLLPKHLSDGIEEAVDHNLIVSGVEYSTVLVNTYTLLNKYPYVFLEMLKYLDNNKYKGKMWGSGVRIPLRYLPEDAGDHKSIFVGDCGFFCERGDGDNW